MADRKVGRLRILHLLRIMTLYTDDDNPIPMEKIQRYLAIQGFKVDYRTVHGDFDVLAEYGMNIICEGKGKSKK